MCQCCKSQYSYWKSSVLNVHCKGGHYDATGGISLSPPAIMAAANGCRVHLRWQLKNSHQETTIQKQQYSDKQACFGLATHPGISGYCSGWGQSKEHCLWSRGRDHLHAESKAAGLKPGCWRAGPQWNGCQSASRSAASLQRALQTGFSLHKSCNRHQSYIALLSSFPQGTLMHCPGDNASKSKVLKVL